MTTDQLVELLANRGLTVVVHEGQPTLRGKRSELTPSLAKVVQWHREELCRRLGIVPKPRMRQYLWRTGHTSTTDEWDDFCLSGGWPVGAFWWRYVGDREWVHIPGTNEEGHPKPDVE